MSRPRGKSVSSLLKMKALGPLGVIAVAAFYVAWPLYAGYEIKTSLDTHNVEGLNARIDFASVRTSLRPAVAAKVEQVVTDALGRAGTAGGALADQLKASVMPRIVDGVLAALVTPEMLIRMHASGKSLKETLDSMVLERASQAQGVGGFLVVPQDQTGGTGTRSKIEEIAGAFGIDTGKVLGGVGAKGAETAVIEPPAEPLPAKGGAKPKYGLGNIKHFSFTGPLGLSVGVSRDANARKPELTADMTFVDGSWKLTGLVPEM
ncbi:DUF2939 domain-containing protein [Hyphomicrobium sp.]|uniref:DUF2939 domain-containing protein n=1 Tax=Hyphomicrobium sp. TaxID=82 RepID=UPI0025BBF056|nr:DUF2939 domain-containing protein [Hyphomicrobium sp.]MCC7254219.1 DUF2939 domain-containing protein [Hyphomicrobium sp.]